MTTPIGRSLLNEAQLSAALAVAGANINHKHSPLARLQKPAQPLPLLQGTGLLDNSGHRLIPRASEAIHLLANPAYKLTCVFNNSGELAWKEVMLLHSGQESGVSVAMEKREDGYELVLLPSLTDTVKHVDQLLCLPELPTQSSAPSTKLNLVAYAAMLAGADAFQATHLRCRLARSRALKPVLTPNLLETELGQGLSHQDTRWAVTAGQRISPIDLKMTVGRMATGLAGLQTAGLVGTVPRGFGFSPATTSFANAFTDLVNTSGFRLTLARDTDEITIAQVGLFRCGSAIWVATIEELSPADAGVRLSHASKSAMMDLIRGFLDPRTVMRLPPLKKPHESSAERRCPSCDKLVRAGLSFCTECGFDFRSEQAVVCPRCGFANKSHKGFCTNCGTRVPAQSLASQKAPQSPNEQTKLSAVACELRCSNAQCGRIIPARKKFCTTCGTPVT